MSGRISLFIFNVLLLVALSTSFKWYDQHQVIRVIPTNDVQLQTLRFLMSKSQEYELDFWKEPTKIGSTVDIQVHKSNMDFLTNFLRTTQTPWKVGVENVKDLIEQSTNEFNKRTVFKRGSAPSTFAIDQYHNTQEINDWIESLATTYPSIVSVFSIGKSHEGSDMKVIKIGSAGTNKKGYWMDACIHAREWITSGTMNYIINELTSKYSTDSTYKNLVDNIDFYFLPITNPDGYEYSINTDRTWRKTRSGPYKGGLKQCYGVDANRNWDNHWGGSGSSNDPCDDTYEGPKAMSEIEVQNIANWMTSNIGKLDVYVSLHSYSDYFMYPYSYAKRTYPPNVDQLKSIANKAVAAIKNVQGTTYTVGSPSDILYNAAGNSMDWATDSAKITIAYSLELRPGDGDTVNDKFYGFNLPASYIVPVGTETWAGLQVVAQSLIDS